MAENKETAKVSTDLRTPPRAGGPRRVKQGPTARMRAEQGVKQRREIEGGYRFRAPNKPSAWKRALPYLIAGGSTAGAFGIAGFGHFF